MLTNSRINHNSLERQKFKQTVYRNNCIISTRRPQSFLLCLKLFLLSLIFVFLSNNKTLFLIKQLRSNPWTFDLVWSWRNFRFDTSPTNFYLQRHIDFLTLYFDLIFIFITKRQHTTVRDIFAAYSFYIISIYYLKRFCFYCSINFS